MRATRCLQSSPSRGSSAAAPTDAEAKCAAAVEAALRQGRAAAMREDVLTLEAAARTHAGAVMRLGLLRCARAVGAILRHAWRSALRTGAAPHA